MKKENGNAFVYALCFCFIFLLFLIMSYGMNLTKIEYNTVRANEIVTESILAADYMDIQQYATTGDMIFDCSPPASLHCDSSSCMYAALGIPTAMHSGWEKALYRFRECLKSTVELDDSLHPVNSGSALESVEILEFRIYNILGNDVYEYNGHSLAFYPGAGTSMTAPSGEAIDTSGVYVDVIFYMPGLGQVHDLHVRLFVGMRT